jgi:hypothetical protein
MAGSTRVTRANSYLTIQHLSATSYDPVPKEHQHQLSFHRSEILKKEDICHMISAIWEKVNGPPNPGFWDRQNYSPFPLSQQNDSSEICHAVVLERASASLTVLCRHVASANFASPERPYMKGNVAHQTQRWWPHATPDRKRRIDYHNEKCKDRLFNFTFIIRDWVPWIVPKSQLDFPAINGNVYACTYKWGMIPATSRFWFGR